MDNSGEAQTSYQQRRCCKQHIFCLALGTSLIVASVVVLAFSASVWTSCDYRSVTSQSNRLVSRSILLTRLLFGNLAVLFNERYYMRNHGNVTSGEASRLERILSSLDNIHRTVKAQKYQLKMIQFMLDNKKTEQA